MNLKSINQQFKNALAIIRQINKDQWNFKGHLENRHDSTSFRCYTAERKDIELWVASGQFFCEVKDQPWQLGWFGILVWHLAARKKVKELERQQKPFPDDLTK